MFKGETFTLTVNAKNPDGSPKDLTAATIYFTLKNWYSEPDASAVCQLSTATTGITVTNVSSGVYIITMIPRYTSLLVGDGPIPLIFDSKVIDQFGVESIQAYGRLLVKPTATLTI